MLPCLSESLDRDILHNLCEKGGTFCFDTESVDVFASDKDGTWSNFLRSARGSEMEGRKLKNSQAYRYKG